MFKKAITIMIGVGVSLSIHANTISKSNSEIVAIAKNLQVRAEQLAEAQTNSSCFESLSGGAEYLGYIPQAIELDRETAKMMASQARRDFHTAVLNNCAGNTQIKALDSETNQLAQDI